MATLWKMRINILTTSPNTPHHKAWMSIDPLFEEEVQVPLLFLWLIFILYYFVNIYFMYKCIFFPQP